MNQLNQFLTAYAEPVLFLALFAEQLGLPLPAAPILVAAGALAADGALNPGLAVGITIVACVLADMIWFYVGRRGGAGLLRFLCKLALRDASSFERTERLFARHGMTAVAAAKFVPGLGLLMPPMAGAFGIDLRRFLRFDALGSFLYVTFYLELGVLFFSNEVNGLLKLISRFGVASATLAFALVMIFVAYKYVRRRKASKRSPDAPAIRVGSPFRAVRIADGLLLASFGLTLFFGAILPDACLAFRRIVFWNWQLALPPDGRHLVTTTGQYY